MRSHINVIDVIKDTVEKFIYRDTREYTQMESLIHTWIKDFLLVVR